MSTCAAAAQVARLNALHYESSPIPPVFPTELINRERENSFYSSPPSLCRHFFSIVPRERIEDFEVSRTRGRLLNYCSKMYRERILLKRSVYLVRQTVKETRFVAAIEKPVTKQFHRYASNLKRLRFAITEVAENRRNVRGGA